MWRTERLTFYAQLTGMATIFKSEYIENILSKLRVDPELSWS